MKRIFTHLFSLVALSVLLFSCGKEKVDPQNIIEDPQGVKLYLTWTVDGGRLSATSVDIELELLKATSTNSLSYVDGSYSTSASETVILNNQNSDGSYVGQVEYGSGSSRVDYTLQVSGVSTNKTQTFNSYFTANDEGLEANLVKIVKTGNSYRVERYSAN